MRELVKFREVVSCAHRWKSDADCWREYTYETGAFNRLVVTDLAESWTDFLEWSSSFQNWGFRGQRESSWTLQSSQERRIKVARSYGNLSGHRHLDRKVVGEKLLSDFRELAPLHLPDLPSNDDSTGWLALMQHYGGPTRLLDWTKCPFVGMYFALREEPAKGSRSAVWAIDLDWLRRKEREILGAAVSTHNSGARFRYLNSLLGQSKIPLVVPIEPQWTNERIAAQKGFFLWKLYEETPLFDEMLMDMMLHPEIVQSPVIRKLEVSPELRGGFMERLFREKNLHEASLFPGRDFCEPLKLELQEMVERAKAEDEEHLRSIQMDEVVRG
jgi:FRG domain